MGLFRFVTALLLRFQLTILDSYQEHGLDEEAAARAGCSPEGAGQSTGIGGCVPSFFALDQRERAAPREEGTAWRTTGRSRWDVLVCRFSGWSGCDL